MSILKLKCTECTIIVEDKVNLYSGSRNVDTIEVAFDSAWNDFKKTAVFYVSETEVYHVEMWDNIAKIPAEVLAVNGNLYIGVFGILNDKRLTSSVLKYQVAKGSFIGGMTPSGVDIYTQLQTLLDAKADKTEVDELRSLIGEGGGGGSLSSDFTTALLNCFANVAWKGTDGKKYYDALSATVSGGGTAVVLRTITAVYNGSEVETGTDVTTLDITVTANYSDGSKTVITDYEITGFISIGSNRLTITYGGKNAYVDVIGVAEIKAGILGKLISYRMNTILSPEYKVSKNGFNYEISINPDWSGTVNFQNGRLIGSANLESDKTYKLSISNLATSTIYLYGTSLPENEEAIAGSGTLLASLSANTKECTFTPSSNFSALRLAPNVVPISLYDIYLEEV